jgi:tetratricopeptide (TPR) repeat protein
LGRSGSLKLKETAMFISSTLKHRSAAAAAMLLVMIVAFGAIPSRALATEIRITPDAKVDERLFLLRLLETMYETWPTDVRDQNAFVAAAAEHRATAIRMREHCRREKLGADLEGCFNEYVQTLDAYTDFLANIGQIRKEAAEQAQKDGFNAGFNAGMSGAGAYGAMQQGNYTSGEAAAVALIIGGIQYLVDSSDKTNKRDAAEKRLVEAAARNMYDRFISSLENIQAAARKLTKANGWGRAEAGFELDFQAAAQVQQLIERNDIQGLLRVYDDASRSRPRDPFVRLARNAHRAEVDNKNPAALLRHARDCLDAASLVPEGQIFDEFRTMCVYLSAELAYEARSVEIMTGIKPAGSTEASQFAVSCYDWILKNGPRDSTGKLGEDRAFCLMTDGQLDAALEQANKVAEQRKNDPVFSYNYACLMSRIYNTDRALEWLNAAIRQGYTDVLHIKADPDLENLRRREAKGFAEAVKITYTWAIDWGTFNDDIILTNTSKFPISGVVLDAVFVENGTRWTTRMKTNVIIRPGESYRWVKVVSIRRSHLTACSATLTCDQNK